MHSKNESILRRFLYTLQVFKKEGKVFTTYRTYENAIAGVELKGFETQEQADNFIKSQFAPDETPTEIERIDKIIRDIEQGKLVNREDLISLEPYLKKEKTVKKPVQNDDLLGKVRNRGPARKLK